MRRTIQVVCALVCAAVCLAGCGSSSGSEAKPDADGAPATTPPTADAQAASGEGVGQAPQQVCDFKDTWAALDGQLADAEKDLHDAPLWRDTASAFGAVSAPEAVKDAWGPLAAGIDAIAQAVDSGDEGQIRSATTSRLPEEQRLHQNFTAFFGQLCP